jgi:hypothetical protein
MGLTFISPLYIGEGATGLAGFLRDLNPLSVSMELVLNGPRWIADHSVHSVVGFVAPFLALVLAAWLFRRLSPAFADYV